MKQNPRQSFENWWKEKGRYIFPATLKEGVYITFCDAWTRAVKNEKFEPHG